MNAQFATIHCLQFLHVQLKRFLFSICQSVPPFSDGHSAFATVDENLGYLTLSIGLQSRLCRLLPSIACDSCQSNPCDLSIYKKHSVVIRLAVTGPSAVRWLSLGK